MRNEKLLNLMTQQYGKGSQRTIEIAGEQMTGIMYGDSDCWSGSDFFQFFITDVNAYRAYYESTSDVPLDDLDYSHPSKIIEFDEYDWEDVEDGSF